MKQKIEKEYALKQSHLAIIQDEYDLTKKPINSITVQLENEKKSVEQQLQQFEKMLEKLREFEDGQIMGDGRSDFTRESKEFLFDMYLLEEFGVILDLIGKIDDEMNKRGEIAYEEICKDMF